MKASSNYGKISPKKFAKARDTIFAVHTKPSKEPLVFRNNLAYNSDKIHRFSVDNNKKKR